MIDWFYVKHRWLALKRDRSKENSWLVIFFLLIFAIQVLNLIYDQFPFIAQLISEEFSGYKAANASMLIFLVFLLLSFTLFLLFSPPNLDYLGYSIWKTNPKEISVGYLLISPISPIQFIGLLLMIPVLMRVHEHHSDIWLYFLGLWLSLYFLTISIHFSAIKLPMRSIGIATASLILPMILYFEWTVSSQMLWVGWIVLPFSIFGAFMVLNRYQYIKGVNTETKHQKSIWELVNFKTSLMQLEWSLITRNKRTRSNMIAGLISIPLIFYLFSNTEDDIVFMPILFIGLILTAFVMLQHGIYMMGWEGSYFDLLISRFSMREFFEFKYRFFVLSSLGMFGLSSFLLFWNQNLFIPLLAALFYNLGVNIYIILQGSLSNTTKLDLNQKTVLNTQALNGTLMMNSILIVLLPVILFAIAKSYLGETGASLVLVGIGAIGMALKRPLLSRIIQNAEKKKYSLANGFRA